MVTTYCKENLICECFLLKNMPPESLDFDINLMDFAAIFLVMNKRRHKV